jgi:2-dehydropantoate 2-reductase
MTTSSPSVTILGAGAMGAAFASYLYIMDPACVRFVADGDRCTRLQADGFIVNGTHYPIPVVRPDDPAAPADLVIVALKDHHVARAVHDLRNHVGPETVILSVMNGLDSEAQFGAVYGMEKVLYAISVGIDAQRSGNVINFSKLGTLFFGEADNTILSDRVKRLQALFDRANIGYKTPQDMIRTMWWKFMINVGVNQASAVMGAPYGVFQTNPDAQAVMEAAQREVIAVAQAEQVNLVENDIPEWYDFLNMLHPEGKTSMLQDVVAGRKTEVEIFAGKVVALGREHGIPTPVNQTLLHAIRVIEAQYATRQA